MTPETVVIVEEPPDFASVTVLPGTGFDCASFNVTVTVEVVELSAAMLAARPSPSTARPSACPA